LEQQLQQVLLEQLLLPLLQTVLAERRLLTQQPLAQAGLLAQAQGLLFLLVAYQMERRIPLQLLRLTQMVLLQQVLPLTLQLLTHMLRHQHHKDLLEASLQ
jgi:hypothetical protein